MSGISISNEDGNAAESVRGGRSIAALPVRGSVVLLEFKSQVNE